jgi:hypothetical protein
LVLSPKIALRLDLSALQSIGNVDQPSRTEFPRETPNLANPENSNSSAASQLAATSRNDTNKQTTLNCSKNVYYETDGTPFEAYLCEDSVPVHPYASYPTKSLENLAYSDPEAALMLGKRFSEHDEDTAVKWMVRASALDGGSTEPLIWLVNNLYSATEVDGEFQTDTVGKRYIMQRVAKELGNTPAPYVFTHSLLTEHGVSPAQFELLDRAADKILQSIARIQYNISGTE